MREGAPSPQPEVVRLLLKVRSNGGTLGVEMKSEASHAMIVIISNGREKVIGDLESEGDDQNTANGVSTNFVDQGDCI